MKTNYLRGFIGLRGLALGCLLEAGALALMGADSTSTTIGVLSPSDMKFVNSAAMGGMLETKLGQMASEKAVSLAVQQFGQKVADDHMKAEKKLKTIAELYGTTIPQTLSGEKQKEVDRLAAMKGDQFDREYFSLMVRNHKSEMKEFQTKAANADSQQVKQFALETAQMMQGHLNTAMDLERQLNLTRAATGAQ